MKMNEPITVCIVTEWSKMMTNDSLNINTNVEWRNMRGWVGTVLSKKVSDSLILPNRRNRME